MKTVQFEERYFASKDKWEYFLSQIGVKDNKDDKYIDTITLTVDRSDIDIEYQKV